MKTKKVKTLILSMAVCFGMNLMSVGAFAATLNSNKILSASQKAQAKEYMLSIGLNKNFVNNAPDSELSKYVNGKKVSQTKKYYRIEHSTNGVDAKKIEISKDECDKEIAQQKSNISIDSDGSNSTSNSWMEMDLTATDDGDNVFTISNACTWLTTPDERDNDVIGIGHDTNLTTKQNTSYFYSQCYDHSTGGGYWKTSSSSSPLVQNAGGNAFKWALPDDSYNTSAPWYYDSFYAYMSYNVVVSSNSYSGDLSAYGDYEHQNTSYSFSPSISYPLGGSISVSSSNKYDAINCEVEFDND